MNSKENKQIDRNCTNACKISHQHPCNKEAFSHGDLSRILNLADIIMSQHSGAEGCVSNGGQFPPFSFETLVF